MTRRRRAERRGNVARTHVGFVVFTALAFWSRPGTAQVAARFSIEERGDFALIGNTLAHDCALEAEPETGDVGACGLNADDTGADVLWSVAEDGTEPIASTSVTPSQAASVAVLELPAGAVVRRADLYWSAQSGTGDPTRATFGRGDAALSVDADRTNANSADGNDYYQSHADVTDVVRQLGKGPYRLSDIDVRNPLGLVDSALYAGWWLAVFYALDSEPLRHLVLYDRLEVVGEGEPQSVRIDGFEVPRLGIDAKLAVVGFDGDASLGGDQLRFGRLAPLGSSQALDGSNNFFDGSRRSSSGQALSVDGDLPQMSGDAGSMSGVDLHVVDVAGSLVPGQTSAEVLASTTEDRFFLSGLVFSLAIDAPDLTLSSHSVRDVDGPPLRPGDELEYTVDVNNSGAGSAPQVTLRVPLPAQVSYVSGSLAIALGANAGALTDAVDGDVGELDAGAGQTLIVRLGQGAGPSNGGRLDAGQSSVVTYRVRLEPGASGSIVSQALVGLTRPLGSEASVTLTDSDPQADGVSVTEIRVDDCASDADCGAGRCDVGLSPRRCVECLVDADCPGLTPTCDANHACACVPRAAELTCDGKDDDCDGAIDEGLAGASCDVVDGPCHAPGVNVCDATGGVRCAAIPSPDGSVSCESEAADDCADPLDPACSSAAPESTTDPAIDSMLAGGDSESRLLLPTTQIGSAPDDVELGGLGQPTGGRSSGAVLGGGGVTCSLGLPGPARGPAPWLGVALALLSWRRAKQRY